MHPLLPKHFLAAVHLNHGSPTLFVLLAELVVMPNLFTDPVFPPQTTPFSKGSVIDIINLFLQRKKLITLSWLKPQQVILGVNGTP